MRAVLVVILAAAVGCGFEGPTGGGVTDANGGDARDGAVPGDTAADAPVMLGPFGMPARIAVATLNGIAEDPACTNDRLELYFVSARAGGTGGVDIWRMTRATVTMPWGAPQVVSALNSAADEFSPGLSPDGLSIWFTSNRSGGGGGGFDLWTAKRATVASTFDAPAPVPELNSADTDSGPAAFTTTRLVFHRIVAGRRQLHEVTRPDPGATWGTPVNLAELNTGIDDRNPHLMTILELYFASERAGGLGGQDLYVAQRPAVDMPFGAASRVDPLSTSSGEASPWVSPDGHHIVFASDRSGSYELYEASR